MKWQVSGAWKADGGEASMTVEAVSQRAAEAIAAQRGMMVEEAIPQAATAQAVAMDYATPHRVAAMPVKKSGPSEAKKIFIRVRLGLLVGGLLLIATELALGVATQNGQLTALGYLGSLMFCAWIVLLFAGLFVK